MKAVIQRVKYATLKSENKLISSIDNGLLVMVGVQKNDTIDNAKKLSEKIVSVRLFSDENDKINLNVNQVNGQILLVSNFTLCTLNKSGTRPDFGDAMNGADAKLLYDQLFDLLNQKSDVKICAYGEDMQIETMLDGPITYQYEC